MALIDNLISYWKLDEASGNASDSVGSNTLTNNNTVGYAPAKINNGADFGASNSNKSFNRTSTTGISTGARSISLWLKMNTEISSGRQDIISFDKNDGSRVSMRYEYNGGTRRLVFQGWNITNNYEPTHNATLGTSSWAHLVLTYEPSATLRGYLNGTEVVSTAIGAEGSPFAIGDDLEVGALEGSGYLSGLVDEIGIWSRALTAGEVLALYNAGNGQAYPLDTVVGVSNQITDTNNDVFDDGTNIDLNGADELIIGEHPSLSIEYTGGFRFTGLAIPQGAVITEAKILLVNDVNSTGTPSLAIQGEDTDDSAIFSTHADFVGRTRTTASVAWTPGAQTAETKLTTVDIKDVVQEIVDRPGWTSGNDMSFFIKNNGGVNSWILVYDYTVSAANSAQIQVAYSTGLSVEAPLGSLTLTGYVPTLSYVDPVNVLPPLGTITLTGHAPTIQVGIWNNIQKHLSSWTNTSKNSSTWTNLDKSD